MLARCGSALPLLAPPFRVFGFALVELRPELLCDLLPLARECSLLRLSRVPSRRPDDCSRMRTESSASRASLDASIRAGVVLRRPALEVRQEEAPLRSASPLEQVSTAYRIHERVPHAVNRTSPILLAESGLDDNQSSVVQRDPLRTAHGGDA